MEKIDLQKYVDSFDVEEDKLCYCWSCLDKDPSMDVRALLCKVMAKLGDDFEPDYVIMTLIKAVFEPVSAHFYKDFIEWAKDRGLPPKEFIERGILFKYTVDNKFLVEWMKSPYANFYTINARFVTSGNSLFDNVLAGYLLWSHEIQSVIKQHILSTLKEGCDIERCIKCGYQRISCDCK